MSKHNYNSIPKSILLLAIWASISLLGCGGDSGGGNSIPYESNNRSDYDYSSSSYYDSSNSDINNLAVVDKIYSAYNGNKSLEIKNIPVDSSGEVLYACLITNPNNTAITDLKLIPPLTYNIRASENCVNDDCRILESSSDIYNNDNKALFKKLIPFRENLVVKAELREELYNKYLENESTNNKNNFLRANISHQDEIEGQKDIIVKVLSKKRYCSLAKISNYAKFFIDQDSDGSVSAPSITEASLQQFATEFDNYIYPILRDNFGNGTDNFWRDVDNDGKLSIVFSPVYNNYGDNVAGIFDTASLNDQNYARDMIGIAVKSGKSVPYEKWFMDARETISHEMQHIVNFSAKSGRSEETWIDEGLSVLAEILYRKKRRENGLMSYSMYYGSEQLDFEGNDSRFYYASYYKPELSVTNFNYNRNDTETALAQYGQKGLFFYYLYEQYGQEQIRRLCQSSPGISKFSDLDRNLNQLSIDFNFATLYEKLRNIDITNHPVNPYTFASSKHKFNTNMNLNYVLTTSDYFRETYPSDIEKKFIELNSTNKITIVNESYNIPANGGTIRIFLKQPKNFSNLLNTNNYTLTFDSSRPIVINMIRVTGN